MSPRLLAVLSTLFVVICAHAVEPPSAVRDIAIVGANVIAMVDEKVAADATVLIRDGIITAVGTRATTIPAGAQVIEARGKYLLPGLAEMHAHVPGSGDRVYRDDVLLLYVAHGVTLARGMLGEQAHLQLRQDLKEHRVLGPRLYTSGPSFNGNSVKTIEQAVARVKEQSAAGYDFLKIHPGLTREIYLAMSRQAKESKIAFAGHVPIAVGLELALAQGQSTIDHLDGCMQILLPPERRFDPDPMFGLTFMSAVEPKRMRDLVNIIRAANAWVVPTQTLLDNFTYVGELADLESRAEMRYVPAALKQQYQTSLERMQSQMKLSSATVRDFIIIRRAMIKALHDGRVGMLLGSDAPQIYNVPGAALLRELRAMVDAGLTPYQALRMGTAAPAEFLAQRGRFGTLVPGAEADLVLVAANPLQNIDHMQQIEGVMVRGRWLDKKFLERELNAVAARSEQ